MRGDGLGFAATVGQKRNSDLDSTRARRKIQPGFTHIAELRLFHHDDAMGEGGAAQQMLGALPDEIPPQVREAEQ